MTRDGYSKATLQFTSKALRLLAKNCNLDEPNAVKDFIASYETADSYKRNLSYAYSHYVKEKSLEWTPPRYRMPSKLPKIPTEEKLNMIISASQLTLAVKLSISKETGLRPIELCKLRVRDIDLEKGLIYPNTAKHGSARRLKLSAKTLDMLKTYLGKRDLALNDKLFKGDSDYYGKKFRQVRNRIAQKLSDPSLKTIRLYDFRHFYATMLYHKTKDILLVKHQMGHRKIETTLIYTQLIDFNQSEEWTCKTAINVDEASKLIEVGFEYITEMDGLKLFRKRK